MSDQSAARPFERPVTVLVGLGFPCRIESASGALSFLEDMPVPLRDEAWMAATDACRDARDGRAPIEEAQDVLTAFARRRGILVEEAPPVMTAEEEATQIAA
ncbi:MAG: DUF982 domain-containing protein [Rhizobiaceae bacterium]|nr:DUF982 domain-containing protein [Rhizobiaceae bacterium]MCV0405500.1 DUF982 domain-containing protein [Rhizobiaceae bacterium]